MKKTNFEDAISCLFGKILDLRAEILELRGMIKVLEDEQRRLRRQLLQRRRRRRRRRLQWRRRQRSRSRSRSTRRSSSSTSTWVATADHPKKRKEKTVPFVPSKTSHFTFRTDRLHRLESVRRLLSLHQVRPKAQDHVPSVLRDLRSVTCLMWVLGNDQGYRGEVRSVFHVFPFLQHFGSKTPLIYQKSWIAWLLWTNLTTFRSKSIDLKSGCGRRTAGWKISIKSMEKRLTAATFSWR